MRLNPPLTITALIVAAFVTIAVQRDQSGLASKTDNECGPVIAYLEAILSDRYLLEDRRKLFLTTESTSLSLPDLKDLSPAQLAAFDADPFSSLYRKLAKVDQIDPRTKCATLVEFLNLPRVRTRFTRTQPQLRKPDDDWDAIWVSVSMPAISSDGKEAIMMSGLTFAPLAGGAEEVYLRRDRDGRWVVKYKQNTWIS
jgi:hypothetical protein